MWMSSRNLYKCNKAVYCVFCLRSSLQSCYRSLFVYPLFYTALCCCLFISFSLYYYFYTDVIYLYYFFFFINHINKTIIFVFEAFVYHFKNTISIIVTIFFYKEYQLVNNFYQIQTFLITTTNAMN